jgi:rhodanese-related sulfurtransferase
MTGSTSRKTLIALLGYIIAIGVVILAVVITVKVLKKDIARKTLPMTISVTEASTRFAAGAFLLDVREQSEWNTAHIKGAVLIPLGQLSSRLSEIPTDRDVLIICHSGNRSAQARDQLRAAGYLNTTSIDGGMTAWMAAGLQVVTGP